ncbi:unnamed protein product, partial [Didymodactylos carnosus]
MRLIQLLICLVSFMILDARYSLYHSDDRQDLKSTFDCLYAYLRDYVEDGDARYIINYHLIPYCQRLDQNEEQENLSIRSYENVENNINFTELYRQGVTSAQLLGWSAPIDVAERYEKNGENSSEVFYNCSSPWFGPTCQYSIEYDILPPFSNVVQFIITPRTFAPDLNFTIGTCYSFLTGCYRGPSPMCLDWREICDGKFDCINGEDEQLCQILEVNECSDNEFRCYFGGQCIPSTFVNDGHTMTDCLDTTDEVSENKAVTYFNAVCSGLPTFRCEESSSRRLLTFPCGDGEFKEHLIPRSQPGCASRRDVQMTSTMFTSLDYISNLDCQLALYCLLRINKILSHIQIPTENSCESLVNRCPSKWLVTPEYPIMYGFFQFVYLTNRSVTDLKTSLIPDFICFNVSRCPALASCSVDIGMNTELNCCRTVGLINATIGRWLEETFTDLVRRCSTIGTDQNCLHSSLFHCPLSLKCISKHRLVDGWNDCYYGEDELFPACQLNDSWRFICESEPNKCLSMIALGNGDQNCRNGEDELTKNQRNILKGSIPFGLFCDGENDLLWMNMLNETDETHCEWWPCNTPNVQCDNVWHCLNGADELNCRGTKCLSNEHRCQIGFSKEYICVPILHLMETSNCETFFFRHIYLNNVIFNDSMNYFLWNQTKCIMSEQICLGQPSLPMAHEDVCLIDTKLPPAYHIAAFISGNIECALSSQGLFRREPKRFLRTSRLSYFPSTSTIVSVRQAVQFERSTVPILHEYDKSWYCNRGILILFENNKTIKCLCPPSYFGDRCQWQNQRISLTLQLIYRSTTFFMPVYQVIIMIIDEQRQITSYHEQITFVPKRDCDTKFNIYLLYPHQPKSSSTNYSIHIDIFDKITLTYWASWHLSIPFQFLPVNRIAAQLFIPNIQQSESCPLLCGNRGRCIRYINKNFLYFCQCDQGYSGLQCDIQQNCSCSLDSFCHTSSICICPMNKYGPKCYLKHLICQSSKNPCENNGLCVPIDDRIALNNFTCLCKENFYGTKCENTKNRIDIEFNEEIFGRATAVFIHYITAFENSKHQRTTTVKKIKYDENIITLLVTQPFHILIAELFNQNYYLIVLRETFIESEYIRTKLTSKQRCVSVHELLNTTFRSYSRLKRIKYYPLLCRQHQQLMCFYDENYMCICDLDRFSNCFTFDHSTTYDCHGYSDCKYGGQCFQDNITCPSVSVCVCPDCYYGTKCQFSTRGFVLSLDYILGYHIKPNVSFFRQPLIVKMSVALTTVMFIFGSLNGILSIATFRMKKTRDVGCGFYLLVSSWISIFIVIVMIIKFWQLVLSQMAVLTNRSLLIFNCLLLDMILQVLLTSNDWLDGCVSAERVFTVIKNVNFNKSKSKQIAKWITLNIILLTLITHLHVPIHRHLIDDIDTDEQRTWCLIQYSSSINIFNSFITLFHFLIPFIINLISILCIIILISRSHLTLHPRLTFKEHLHLQFKQHKHHLIASCTLALLVLPRLSMSFIGGCMKSPHNSWLYLFAYFIPFLPSMVTFIVFVLPSKT